MNVISVGDLVLDITLPVSLPLATFQHTPTRRVEPGGAANFMIAARRMGLNVSAVGAVGADVFGAQVVEVLDQEGIDTAGIVAAPGSTTTLVIVLTDQQSGEHVFVGQFGEGPEVQYPALVDDLIAKADAMFVQGYTLAENRVAPVALRAIERAASQHVPLYLDVGPFMAHVSPERVRWVLERTTVGLMTEDEVPLVSGGMSGEAAYDFLLQQGLQAVVVKQGAAGCRIITRESSEHVPGFAAQVVDTVGAGDCFDAAFLAGRLGGLGLRESGLLANAMGAASVQKMGAGTNTPTADEVKAVLPGAGITLDFAW